MCFTNEVGDMCTNAPERMVMPVNEMSVITMDHTNNAEKLIPLMMENNFVSEQETYLYTVDCMQIRDWLHVSDHCSTASNTVLQFGKLGEVYNIG